MVNYPKNPFNYLESTYVKLPLFFRPNFVAECALMGLCFVAVINLSIEWAILSPCVVGVWPMSGFCFPF